MSLLVRCLALRLASMLGVLGPALGLVLTSGHAEASISFPGVIKSHWRIDKLPVPGDGCRLCHDTDDGGTVTRLFGRTAKLEHASEKDNDSLRRALDAIRQKHYDSDRDDVTDYQEVAVDGTDPNNPREFVEPPPPPPPPTGGGGNVSGEGGAGDGGAEAGGEGGAPPQIGRPVHPDFGSLPPPLEHGCSTSPARGPVGTRSSFLAMLLFGATLVWHRARGRRYRA
jgi:hypothetical protein